LSSKALMGFFKSSYAKLTKLLRMEGYLSDSRSNNRSNLQPLLASPYLFSSISWP
jgi:hypothetical protein